MKEICCKEVEWIYICLDFVYVWRKGNFLFIFIYDNGFVVWILIFEVGNFGVFNEFIVVM